MPMLHKTQGIVLRIIRYGETSLIAHVFTELFGIQSYLVNGVRTSKKGSSRAPLLQPANILDLVVYYREGGHLQRISDFRFAYLYRHLHTDIVKNAVALYVVELLDKTLRQPEAHADLFHFAAEALRWMDTSQAGTANLPLFFTLRLSEFLGFRFYRHHGPGTPFLDLREGSFVAEAPAHGQFLEGAPAKLTDELSCLRDFGALAGVRTDKQMRQRLLAAYQDYYRLHLPDFPGLRSPAILAEVLE